MEDLLVRNFEIQSHSGSYQVVFDDQLIDSNSLYSLGTHYIIDRNVFELLGTVDKPYVLIDANEENKSYLGIVPVIEQLIAQNLKRSSTLVAIGGGIIQDITCFIANNFMRGVRWHFVPTTLLAQADSCIGSKSSINFGQYKNLLGSFTPPSSVLICNKFLNTLEDKDIRSGIGEIIKLYLIDGKLVDSDTIRDDLDYHLYQTLQIKKKFIEIDEFDKGIRNILNYGHCIGHAIESATNFEIPHGIAVSMGMDAANLFAFGEGMIEKQRFLDMHNVLITNYSLYKDVVIDINLAIAALTHDKKNTSSEINLILPVDLQFVKKGFENSASFWKKLISSLMQSGINFRS
jgi:3-dehydroquinate synthase